MKPALAPVLLSSVLLLVSGCSNTSTVFPQTVQQRAAFDLSCDQQKVPVQNIGGVSYGATGCEKKASYSCVCMYSVMGKCTKPVCTLDGAHAPGAASTPR